jgi:hypothetical protein
MTIAARVTHGRCLCGACDWTFEGEIAGATICNCTACRRYGGLWIYGHDGVDVHVKAANGQLVPYVRPDAGRNLSFNFCRTCGNLVSWRGLKPNEEGRMRMAVNIRLAGPEQVADIPLYRFDGLHSFDDLPLDGSTVRNVWF